MQRVEGTMSDMGQTMENILLLLKHVDEKLDRITPNNNNNNNNNVSSHQRSARSIMSQMNVKFSSVQEEIP